MLDLVEKYLSLKVNVRHNTQTNYNFVLNIIRKEDFGKLRIDKVKQSDAKAWLIKMQKVDGRGYSSIHSIRGVVRPAFEMALQDDLIHKNPFQFELATVVVNDSVTREAITRAQALVCQVVDNLVKAGIEPPVFKSSNVDGGDAHNNKMFDTYYGYWK